MKQFAIILLLIFSANTAVNASHPSSESDDTLPEVAVANWIYENPGKSLGFALGAAALLVVGISAHVIVEPTLIRWAEEAAIREATRQARIGAAEEIIPGLINALTQALVDSDRFKGDFKLIVQKGTPLLCADIIPNGIFYTLQNKAIAWF